MAHIKGTKGGKRDNGELHIWFSGSCKVPHW